MYFGTISGDIISYTSFSENEKRMLEESIQKLLRLLHDKYSDAGFYGRLVQGDYLECAVHKPSRILRIALIIKSLIKSLDFFKKDNQRAGGYKYFLEHGIRLAVAVAPLDTLDPKKGIIDGPAIYLSGRTIKPHSTYGKHKIVIKHTLFFRSPDSELQDPIDAMCSLLDTIISKWTTRQSTVVYFKLLGKNEKEISRELELSQSTISQHSTAAGWTMVEKAILYFENLEI